MLVFQITEDSTVICCVTAATKESYSVVRLVGRVSNQKCETMCLIPAPPAEVAAWLQAKFPALLESLYVTELDRTYFLGQFYGSYNWRLPVRELRDVSAVIQTFVQDTHRLLIA
jgi:hypothetical protein